MFDHRPIDPFSSLDTTSAGAPFSLAIGHVFVMRTEEEMRRTNTKWVVASVEHKQAAWDYTVIEPIGNAVGQFGTAIDAERPVSCRYALADPQPALSGLVDLRPESFLWGSPFRGHDQNRHGFGALGWQLQGTLTVQVCVRFADTQRTETMPVPLHVGQGGSAGVSRGAAMMDILSGLGGVSFVGFGCLAFDGHPRDDGDATAKDEINRALARVA